MTDATTPAARRPARPFPTPLLWRPDARIQEDANAKLAAVAIADAQASEVRLRVTNGEVTLTGSVGRIELRARVEAAARSVRGVRLVRNEIKVDEPVV